jgi:hypothetical protein
MTFSRILAVVFGVLLPTLETIRRWGTFTSNPLTVIEDYVLGALLLSAAWLVGRNYRRGQCLLAGAWGVTCGLGYASFVGQLQRLRLGEADPAPVSTEAVAVIKGVGFALAIVALVVTVLASEGGRSTREPASG